MYSYQIIELGKPLERRDYPTPEPEGTQVLVRVHACGVCHSDIHIWHGYFDLGDGNRITHEQRGCKLPFTMGHEIVGEVAALGPEAEGAQIGDHRIVFPWIGCGECAVCRSGQQNMCAKPQALGARVDGGYSDHVMVPHPRYLVDYEGIDQDLACTYACSGLTAYSALRKVDHLGADEHVVVIGAGGVGLSAIHLAPSVVEAGVIVADIDAGKRDVGTDAGAAHAVDNGTEDAVAQVRDLTGGGAGAAIDFVGRPTTAQFGLDVLRRGGTLVIVGLYGGALSMSLPMFPFTSRHIIGSYVGNLGELQELIALVKAGKVPPIPIETRGLEKASQTLDDLVAGKIVGRVVLRP